MEEWKAVISGRKVGAEAPSFPLSPYCNQRQFDERMVDFATQSQIKVSMLRGNDKNVSFTEAFTKLKQFSSGLAVKSVEKQKNCCAIFPPMSELFFTCNIFYYCNIFLPDDSWFFIEIYLLYSDKVLALLRW